MRIDFSFFDNSTAEQLLSVPRVYFPPLEKIWSVKKPVGNLCVFYATVDQNAIGAIVAEYQNHKAEIISWRIPPVMRGKGLGKKLLHGMLNALIKKGITEVKIRYRSDWKSFDAIQKSLTGPRWEQPFHVREEYCGSGESLQDWPVLKRQPKLSKDFQFFPWNQISDTDRNFIISKRGQSDWHNEGLDPLLEEGKIDERYSIGLRVEGNVLGWCICYRNAPGKVEIALLFAQQKHARRGASVLLLGESARRALDDGNDELICQVLASNKRMIRFSEKRIKPWLKRSASLYRSTWRA